MTSLETYSSYGKLNFIKVQEDRRKKGWAAKIKNGSLDKGWGKKQY